MTDEDEPMPWWIVLPMIAACALTLCAYYWRMAR